MKKMLRINPSKLSEGMKFTAPVFFDDGVNMFLAENHPVKKMHIDALSKWDVPYVITYGSLITNNDIYLDSPELIEELPNSNDVFFTTFNDYKETPTEQINRIIYNLSNQDSEILENYKNILNYSEEIFLYFNNNEKNLREKVDKISEQITKLIKTNWQDIVSYILVNTTDSSLSKNAVDTGIFAGILAREYGFSDRKILQIIIASFLHDVGMLDVPEEVLRKKSQLTTQEFNLLQLHTVRSAQFAENILFYPKEIGKMILSHHERWDGKGYPEKISSSQIDIGARILSIADAFSAMISHKVYRDSIGGYDAMKNLLDSSQHRFDPKLLKLFIQIIGIYPIGSIVILNNNAIAQVVQGNLEMPFLPEVKILVESKNKPILKIGDIIKLKELKELKIVRALKQNEYKTYA
ncbi:MAG: HD-GYP domain-containing protein [Treponema sp.]|nr:HD-GYP domain-containing protein [Treponema sp.]